MNKTNPMVDEFLSKAQRWQEEFDKLRRILLDCGLTEAFKWRQPCYTFEKNNIVIIGGFKEYCALTFFNGSLLKDPHNILEKPGENTRAGRLIRFTNVGEIIEMEPILKAYIAKAIDVKKAGVKKAGLKVDSSENPELILPEELQIKLDENLAFKSAFEALTPGRQRGYILYFSAPKQSKTRASRVEKYRQRILDGKGFHDCTCGLSKKLPTCDGSHKYIPHKSNT